MIYVGVMGHGTVGSGVVEVLQTNAQSIEKNVGKRVEIKRILDLRDFPESPYKHLFTKNVDDILEDEQISIVAEVMGGLEPAYTYTKKALLKGKHVVTSNKELVAQHGAELTRIAAQNNVNYLYEASVGGGIPIIRPLKQCLAGNEISMITGILNGTTNYILTEMKNKGKDFDEALKDAQENGYAERDPSADIEGYDTQRKIAILATIAFGKQVYYNDIPTKGITGITKKDIIYARELGYVIRLIASASKSDDGIIASVSPMMVKAGTPLADVEDVYNAILVRGNAIGDVMFYGRGAGKLPTASAVVGDIIDAAKNIKGTKYSDSGDERTIKLLSSDKVEMKYFVRIEASRTPDLDEEIGRLFPGCSIVSLDNQLLKDEFAVITGKLKNEAFKEGIQSIGSIQSVKRVINYIRIDCDDHTNI